MQRLLRSRRDSIDTLKPPDSECEQRQLWFARVTGGLAVASSVTKATVVGGLFTVVGETVKNFSLPTTGDIRRDFATGALAGVVVLLAEAGVAGARRTHSPNEPMNVSPPELASSMPGGDFPALPSTPDFRAFDAPQ